GRFTMKSHSFLTVLPAARAPRDALLRLLRPARS
ncbi:MAG: hypothetical protein RL669_2065, partial [Pseudomonadota bacterium]